MARILMGKMLAAHGVKGGLKFRSFTQNPEDIFTFKPLYDPEGHPCIIARFNPTGKEGIFLVFLQDVVTREAAAAWQGKGIYIERSQLPMVEEEDTYYYADLINLQVMGPEGQIIGTVSQVHSFGAGDIVEVRTTQGQMLSVPFTHQYIGPVDLVAGVIHLIDNPC